MTSLTYTSIRNSCHYNYFQPCSCVLFKNLENNTKSEFGSDDAELSVIIIAANSMTTEMGAGGRGGCKRFNFFYIDFV